MPSTLCRRCSYPQKMPSLRSLLDQFTRHSPDVTARAYACEEAPHLSLAQTSLERELKGKLPVYGLSRRIKPVPLTDSSELTISRASAILQKSASPDYAESKGAQRPDKSIAFGATRHSP